MRGVVASHLRGAQVGVHLPRRPWQDVAGLEHRLEVGAHGGPSDRDGLYRVVVGEVFVSDGQSHDLVVLRNLERDDRWPVRSNLAGRVERDHEPRRRIGFKHAADHIGDLRAVDAAMLPARSCLPVRDVAVTPVLGGQVGVGEGLPYPVRGALDVGDVDVGGSVGHGRLLGSLLDGAQRPQARGFELLDPSFLDAPERDRIEVVELCPALAHGRDQVGVLKHAEVLRCRLARHLKRLAQLAQSLTIALSQAVEQASPRRIRQRTEHRVAIIHARIMQAFTCLCQPTPRGAAERTDGTIARSAPSLPAGVVAAALALGRAPAEVDRSGQPAQFGLALALSHARLRLGVETGRRCG